MACYYNIGDDESKFDYEKLLMGQEAQLQVLQRQQDTIIQLLEKQDARLSMLEQVVTAVSNPRFFAVDCTQGQMLAGLGHEPVVRDLVRIGPPSQKECGQQLVCLSL